MSCLHRHCPDCGDTNFDRLHPQDRNHILTIVFTLVTAGLIGPIIASVGYITLGMGFIVFVVIGFAVGLSAFTYCGRYNCDNCGFEFYFPKTRVDLVEEHVEKR